MFGCTSVVRSSAVTAWSSTHPLVPAEVGRSVVRPCAAEAQKAEAAMTLSKGRVAGKGSRRPVPVALRA